jgi:prolyl oligopeptidase
MEDLNAPEVKQWIDAENAITSKYLDSLPVRDALKKAITDLYNYPRVSVPYFEGRRWFYSRNTGLQRQNVIFTRETLTGPETIAIDANQLSPDGSVQLSTSSRRRTVCTSPTARRKADRTGPRTTCASCRARSSCST